MTHASQARQSVNLPSHQEIYDSALNVRSEELDKLREELGIEVGKVPALPPKSDPRQRAWAKPLIARFDELISQEMRKIWVEARKLALNTVANAGVDIVPFVKQCSYASEVV